MTDNAALLWSDTDIDSYMFTATSRIGVIYQGRMAMYQVRDEYEQERAILRAEVEKQRAREETLRACMQIHLDMLESVNTAYDELAGMYLAAKLENNELAELSAAQAAPQPQATPGVEPSPDWSQAPPWANYWARDMDGTGYWYEIEPRLGIVTWRSQGVRFDEDRKRDIDDGWRTTLKQRRPGGA